MKNITTIFCWALLLFCIPIQANNLTPGETTTTNHSLQTPTIAVIPFNMVSNQSSISSDANAEELQRATIQSIKDNTSGVNVLDYLTVNALLAKHNITTKKLKTTLPKELAAILEVDYVVYGIATINKKGSSSKGVNASLNKNKRKSNNKSTGIRLGTSASNNKTKYDTNIEMTFYDKEGQSTYSDKRNTFGSAVDAYQASVDYIVKRCPWGKKSK